MELYETENEQLDAVRGFLRENGKSIAFGTIIALVGLFGWRYWNSHQLDVAMQSSTGYDSVLLSIMTGQDTMDTKVNTFIASNKNNYGVMAALQLAHYKTNNGDYAGAEKQLLQVSKFTNDINLLSLMHIRLARLQLQQQQTDAALHSLDAVKGSSWLIQAYELRGDIHLASGNFDAAKSAYVQAMGLNPPQTISTVLQVKIANIAE